MFEVIDGWDECCSVVAVFPSIDEARAFILSGNARAPGRYYMVI